MADVYLSSLDPMRFTAIVPERTAVIENASPSTHAENFANDLAKKLHPCRQQLVVTEVEDNTKNAKTYTLRADTGAEGACVAYFDAGQYLSFEIKLGDVYTTRPYSVSSSPRDSLDGFYKITVKRVEGGFVSQHILDSWHVGTKVTASAPMGTFTYEPLRDAKNVVALCGGSGITPILSLAKAVSEGTEELSLTVLYGSRTKADILHKSELDNLSKKCDNIKVVYILSDEDREDYEMGFITEKLIRKYAPAEPFSVFICGPEAMYSHLERELAGLSLEKKYIRREVQGESFEPEKLPLYPAGVPERVTVKIKQRDRVSLVEGRSTDTVLRILEKGGIAVPSRCRSGECGFCRAKVLAGEVFVPEKTDRRRLADTVHGYIHPCCTYPLSDIEIEVLSVR